MAGLPHPSAATTNGKPVGSDYERREVARDRTGRPNVRQLTIAFCVPSRVIPVPWLSAGPRDDSGDCQILVEKQPRRLEESRC